MTENEAIKKLNMLDEALNFQRYDADECSCALQMAIQALEKQIPKKPILCMNETSGMFVDYADGQGEYKTQMNNWWKCPCCKSIVGERILIHKKRVNDQRKKKFCENCGQKIEW